MLSTFLTTTFTSCFLEVQHFRHAKLHLPPSMTILPAVLFLPDETSSASY